jgi:hypothetical protein
MKDGRDSEGRFAAGNPGGPGRPKRATEAEYLQALGRVVSVADVVAIARRAVADAKKGSARARDWVSKYLLGDPAPRAPLGSGGWERLARELLPGDPLQPGGTRTAGGGSQTPQASPKPVRQESAPGPPSAGLEAEGCSPEDPATGGTADTAPGGLAAAFSNEEQR